MSIPPATPQRLPFPQGYLLWSEVPWDTDIMGYRVAQVTTLELLPRYHHQEGRAELRAGLLGSGVTLFSIRLPLESLPKSLLLEAVGFRFIEVTHQPHYKDLQHWSPLATAPNPITVGPTREDELPGIIAIAGSAFGHERFHVDPHCPKNAGDLRYANWARNTPDHPRQSLYSLRKDNETIGFFIIETLSQNHIYWHLTAIAPRFQGRGYGLWAWQKMMQLHQRDGIQEISTTVVARNIPILNLYAKLGFRLTSPKMGFHWWAEDPA